LKPETREAIDYWVKAVVETAKNEAEWMRKAAKFFTLRNVLSAAAAIVVFFVLRTWSVNSARLDEFYILPRSSSDWSAWAAWFGLLATAGAVVYAALQFRSDAEEKRKLREDRDADARRDAKSLRVSLYNITPERDRRDVSGIRMEITNGGEEPIKNVQVKIPDVAADITSSDLASIPPDVGDGLSFPPEDPDWAPLAVPLKPFDQEQRWLCSDIPARSMLRIYVRFHEYQSDEVWSTWPESGSRFTGQIEGRIMVMFDDDAGRSWARSSEGSRQLHRLWP
jgi:hypothetical protein